MNHCNLHNHEEESCDVCHHNKFPKETIKEKFGDDVRTCCAGHGYIFKDHCEVINFLLNIVFFFKDWNNSMTSKMQGEFWIVFTLFIFLGLWINVQCRADYCLKFET